VLTIKPVHKWLIGNFYGKSQIWGSTIEIPGDPKNRLSSLEEV
jgi:hypothetical protein